MVAEVRIVLIAEAVTATAAVTAPAARAVTPLGKALVLLQNGDRTAAP